MSIKPDSSSLWSILRPEVKAIAYEPRFKNWFAYINCVPDKYINYWECLSCSSKGVHNKIHSLEALIIDFDGNWENSLFIRPNHIEKCRNKNESNS